VEVRVSGRRLLLLEEEAKVGRREAAGDEREEAK
jgi:hypothetical protein